MTEQEITITTTSAEETRRIAQQWAQRYLEGRVVGLKGDLGAGKTEFVRGALKGLGGRPEDVRSPSFTLLNIYEARLPVFHFDLFRLSSWADLESTGFFEFLDKGTVFIEWPDRVPEVLESLDLLIEIRDQGSGRTIKLVFDPQRETE